MVGTIKKLKKNHLLKMEFFLFYFFVPILLLFTKDFFILPGLLVISFGIILILKLKYPSKLKTISNGRIHWNLLILLTICFFVFLTFYSYFVDKNSIFNFPKKKFSVWVLIIFAYPVFSVIPQEIIFRLFFFTRYSVIFDKKKELGIAVNTLVFSFSHIVFLNFHALFLTSLV